MTPPESAVLAMLAELDKYRPQAPVVPPPPPVPPASGLSLVNVAEGTVGLGNRVGTDSRGPFSVSALKGLRLKAIVRYQLWANTPGEVDLAIQDLIKKLLGEREQLRAFGFLRLALQSTSASEQADGFWRESVEFEVLYEFPYVDSDGAESLIARIPISISEQFSEHTTVTDQMARWDDESAPPLVLRGRSSIGKLSALAFISGNVPGGTVTVTRTFDGASGVPTDHPTLTSFLAAVAGSNPTQRHARVIFTSLRQFLDAVASFKITGQSLDGMKADGVSEPVLGHLKNIIDQEVGGQDEFIALLKVTIGDAQTAAFKSTILKHAATSKPVTMGDWDKDNVPDVYESLESRVAPPIRLGDVDRLEIAYQDQSLDKVAIVYLRATPG